MVTLRVFFAVVCVALFTGSAARADEPKKAEEKVFLNYFTFPDRQSADEIVARLRERGIDYVARAPLFSAIFIMGTYEEILNVIRLIAT